MLFGQDRDLKSGFYDIFEDFLCYSQIPSGESRDISVGFEDGYFHGDAIKTEEMAFALIRQTLVVKIGCFYTPGWQESGLAEADTCM